MGLQAVKLRWRAVSAAILGLSLCTTVAQPYWQSVQQINAAPAPASYTGPGNVVSGAAAFWGLRGYTAAFSGAVANICDVATGAICADATWAAGVLTLPTIGGSPCANSGNVCQVATLYDQSGALACAGPAACTITQATASKRPTLVVPGASNGCPADTMHCMTFVRANSQCLPTAAAAYTQAHPVSAIFTGIRTGNTTSIQGAIGFSSTNYTGWSNSANKLRVFSGAVLDATYNDSVWHAAQITWSNTVGSLSADGSTTAGATGTTAPSSNAIGFGSATASTCINGVEGKLVEAGIWPIAFSAQNISDLNTNAHSYWGF